MSLLVKIGTFCQMNSDIKPSFKPLVKPRASGHSIKFYNNYLQEYFYVFVQYVKCYKRNGIKLKKKTHHFLESKNVLVCKVTMNMYQPRYIMSIIVVACVCPYNNLSLPLSQGLPFS